MPRRTRGCMALHLLHAAPEAARPELHHRQLRPARRAPAPLAGGGLLQPRHQTHRQPFRGAGRRAIRPWPKLLLALLFVLKGTVCRLSGRRAGPHRSGSTPAISCAIPWAIFITRCSKAVTVARTPMPWDAASAHLGFSTGTPWLPLGPAHRGLAVSKQEADPDSRLAFAPPFLAAANPHPALITGAMKHFTLSARHLGLHPRGRGRAACLCL